MLRHGFSELSQGSKTDLFVFCGLTEFFSSSRSKLSHLTTHIYEIDVMFGCHHCLNEILELHCKGLTV